jgi:hypothetical protein
VLVFRKYVRQTFILVYGSKCSIVRCYAYYEERVADGEDERAVEVLLPKRTRTRD